MNWIYILITVAGLSSPAYTGLRYDPDRTFTWAGSCQQTTSFGNLGSLALCDKTGHALAGGAVTLVSFAVTRRPNETCLAEAWRSFLRANAVSALYEVQVAVVNPRQQGNPGWGIGLRDHAAVMLGSVGTSALVCSARAIF